MSKFLFYPGVWLIDNVVTVSGGQQRDSATHIRVSILPQEGRPSGTRVKNPPANAGDIRDPWVRSLGREDPLEEGMATHSSILAWRMPWAEDPSRLQSMGSQG